MIDEKVDDLFKEEFMNISLGNLSRYSAAFIFLPSALSDNKWLLSSFFVYSFMGAYFEHKGRKGFKIDFSDYILKEDVDGELNKASGFSYGAGVCGSLAYLAEMPLFGIMSLFAVGIAYHYQSQSKDILVKNKLKKLYK
ncbi:hypothetical protein KY334_07405 [Candidatus Woesearchaeota archaeon]|nr:hypothetical protein [Candidatus Woesearchaeota archaeon]